MAKTMIFPSRDAQTLLSISEFRCHVKESIESATMFVINTDSNLLNRLNSCAHFDAVEHKDRYFCNLHAFLMDYCLSVIGAARYRPPQLEDSTNVDSRHVRSLQNTSIAVARLIEHIRNIPSYISLLECTTMTHVMMSRTLSIVGLSASYNQFLEMNSVKLSPSSVRENYKNIINLADTATETSPCSLVLVNKFIRKHSIVVLEYSRSMGVSESDYFQRDLLRRLLVRIQQLAYYFLASAIFVPDLDFVSSRPKMAAVCVRLARKIAGDEMDDTECNKAFHKIFGSFVARIPENVISEWETKIASIAFGTPTTDDKLDIEALRRRNIWSQSHITS